MRLTDLYGKGTFSSVATHARYTANGTPPPSLEAVIKKNVSDGCGARTPTLLAVTEALPGVTCDVLNYDKTRSVLDGGLKLARSRQEAHASGQIDIVLVKETMAIPSVLSDCRRAVEI